MDGGVYGPAGTDSAAVMEVLSSGRDLSFSQGVCARIKALPEKSIKIVRVRILRIFMRSSWRLRVFEDSSLASKTQRLQWKCRPGNPE
jgi:uncharacterized ParB-like nuclease family protein